MEHQLEQLLRSRIGPPLSILPGCHRRTTFRCRRWRAWNLASCNHVDYCVEQLDLDEMKRFIGEQSKRGQKDAAIGQVGRHVAKSFVDSKNDGSPEKG
ncbi:hypothetical protein F443_21116 [Phytophthora nicotianae P1569]|uniref:Uncharacterized protein n=1 Tax=Phytophthora nicotianae P1569 TaxID=1317065 RepID=V9DZ91_PHYNI|nr:hypothetical protein F443_21116 [Phytophthora nicotianae P1569]